MYISLRKTCHKTTTIDPINFCTKSSYSQIIMKESMADADFPPIETITKDIIQRSLFLEKQMLKFINYLNNIKISQRSRD